jgi:hypothetical protein
MNPLLASLVALQSLDTAADTARRRLAELPAAEQALADEVARVAATVDAVKTKLAESQTARRQFEKDVAAVDARLARFSDHKAAVKTNQEYTALLHEISTAQAEKTAVEDQILVRMEESENLARDQKAAEAVLAQTKREADEKRAAITKERTTLDAEVTRLTDQRKGEVAGVDARGLATYEQLLKGRRGIAVAKMVGESCTACHVRLRPHFVQQIRRNEGLVQCESCQRILYFEPPVA